MNDTGSETTRAALLDYLVCILPNLLHLSLRVVGWVSIGCECRGADGFVAVVNLFDPAGGCDGYSLVGIDQAAEA